MMQPNARGGPLPLGGSRRDVDDAGGFFNGESAEKAQLDDLRLARIELGETLHGGIEADDVEVDRGLRAGLLLEHDYERSASTLSRVARASVVDKDLPHHLRGQRKEVSAVLQLSRLAAHQAKVCLMDESSGLQSVAAALASEMPFREPAELVVDE